MNDNPKIDKNKIQVTTPDIYSLPNLPKKEFESEYMCTFYVLEDGLTPDEIKERDRKEEFCMSWIS